MQLSLVLVSFLAVAQASLFVDGIVGRDNVDLAKRQRVTPTTSSPDTPPASTSRPATTTTDDDPATTSTPTTTRPTTRPTTTPTTRQTTTSDTSKTTTSTSTTSEAPQSTITLVVTATNSDGSQTTYTTEATTPGLQGSDSGSGGSNTGMTPQTRNTVIGVVVGIGGAVILVGGGLLAWRIWGRKRHGADENDGLMAYNGGYPTVEQPDRPHMTGVSPAAASSTNTGRTPFQSTLESYHAPTQVNPAANF